MDKSRHYNDVVVRQFTIMTVSSVIIAFLAMAVATPLGLFSAIYLTEYSGLRFRKIIKPILEILAGIPTVVYGYFALTFVTPCWIKPSHSATPRDTSMILPSWLSITGLW